MCRTHTHRYYDVSSVLVVLAPDQMTRIERCDLDRNDIFEEIMIAGAVLEEIRQKFEEDKQRKHPLQTLYS